MIPDHLLPLGDEEFSVWRRFCLRSTGMPFEWVADPEIVRQPSFLEALTWQHLEVAELTRRRVTDGRPMKRDLSRTLASYRSRYCAKNDSIGFFGPTAWGRWTDGDTVVPEQGSVTRGQVFFEMWAVQAVGRALAERYDLHDWTVPQVASAVAAGPGGVHLGDGSFLSLSELGQRVLGAVDGFRTVADVAAVLDDGTADAARVVTEIRKLQAMGVLTRGFFIPQAQHPERRLAMQLARVADPARRQAAQDELTSLVRARDRVAAAVGDPAAVASALEALHERFTTVALESSRRHDGRYYAGRTVVYEECRADTVPELGAELRADVAPALGLLLQSARWFSVEIARGYRSLVGELLAQEPDQSADGYPLPRLLAQLAPTFQDSTTGPTGAAARELRRRWTEILAPQPMAGPVTYSSQELRDKVLTAFPATAPGWPTARWHSPDLMLAAASPEDLRDGRWLAVLGEVHPTINSLDQLCFSWSHPDQAGLRRDIDSDMPKRIVPLYSMTDGLVNSRTGPPEAYHSPGYTYLGVSSEQSYAPPRANVVAAGALRVHREDGRLVVRSVVDDFEADLIEVLDDYLALAAFNRFGLLAPSPYQPRIQIDRVVVSRERWQLPFTGFAEFAQARLATVASHVRQVAADRGLPDVAFWVVAGEAKPIYVDLRDDTLIDTLWAKLRRGRQRDPGGSVSVTEMLPGPDQLWLRDSQGRRYTAEFRLTCVDSQQYRGENGE
ncbi:lantibiotic dehydratase [Micromonospora sp. NPDC049051]|uniref:lantibiotic dehydratase n=1 Tax=Micromonospora sp. NPDC049051 TaxID=3364264 RepID=UPI00371C64C1